jgi:hypothetical protein
VLAPILAKAVKCEVTVDVHNKATDDKPMSVADADKWLAAELTK